MLSRHPMSGESLATDSSTDARLRELRGGRFRFASESAPLPLLDSCSYVSHAGDKGKD